MLRRASLVLAAGMAAAAAPAVPPPMMVHVQGRLLDRDDVPLDGTARLTFRFYPSDGSSAQVLWVEDYTVQMAQGVYDINVGDPTGGKNPLAQTLLAQAELWMSIQVNDDAEMTPRLKAGSTFWALRAGNSDTVGGRPAEDFALVDDVARLDGATFTGPLKLAGAPTDALHAATRKYVDDAVAAATPVGYASLSGAQFTGPVTLAGDPTASAQAATKHYVDQNFAPIENPAFTGAVTLPADPTAPAQAATKRYVDLQVAPLGQQFAPIANPTFTGDVTLPGSPDQPLEAATKAYADAIRSYGDATFAPLAGAVFSGPVTVPITPGANGHAASKKYVDDGIAASTAGFIPASSGQAVPSTLLTKLTVSAAPASTGDRRILINGVNSMVSAQQDAAGLYLMVFRRDTHQLDTSNTAYNANYDVNGTNGANVGTSLQVALAGLTTNHIAILASKGPIATNLEKFLDQIFRLGGGAFNIHQLSNSDIYLLIGIPEVGPGNAIELVKPASLGIAKMTTLVVDGDPIGLGSHSTYQMVWSKGNNVDQTLSLGNAWTSIANTNFGELKFYTTTGNVIARFSARTHLWQSNPGPTDFEWHWYLDDVDSNPSYDHTSGTNMHKEIGVTSFFRGLTPGWHRLRLAFRCHDTCVIYFASYPNANLFTVEETR